MQQRSINRRRFLKNTSWCLGSVAAGVTAFSGCESPHRAAKEPLFKISLAEWSLNKALFGKQLDHLDFPKTAKRDYDIHAIELVNQFFMNKATDQGYLHEFKSRADGEAVKILLIMCDDEGDLGDLDSSKRRQAVRNHYKWADAARFFGCHSIRVN